MYDEKYIGESGTGLADLTLTSARRAAEMMIDEISRIFAVVFEDLHGILHDLFLARRACFTHGSVLAVNDAKR